MCENLLNWPQLYTLGLADVWLNRCPQIENHCHVTQLSQLQSSQLAQWIQSAPGDAIAVNL